MLKEYFGFLNVRKNIRDYVARGSFDITFLALVMILLTVGIVMMFSASYVNAWYDSSKAVGNDPYYYFKNQLFFAIIGIAIMLVVSRIRFDVFRDFSCFALLISLCLLVYVLINPYEIPGKEQFKRWMELPLIGSFQPSEIAKLALIMFCAWSMEKKQKLVESKWWMMLPYTGVIAVVCALVYAENHLSGTILMFGIGMVMTFLGGVKVQWFVVGGALAAVAFMFFVLNPDKLAAYAGERIEVWLKLLRNDELTNAEKTGTAWQSLQSLYAIGSGGLFGLGFGNSRQKHLYLPEPQNDFVFAIVCEELGFIRTMIIVILFVLLVCRGFVIALRSRNRYASLLAMGICFHVGLQAALNIAVVTSTVPNTGISLPFFSSGGTALVMLLAEMGMVLSISRGTK